ncbi:MAG TPA: hypothetical protein VHC39_17135, partial [Rhizomicrobium sp.]|nr:hypothetical protein [Rhizomicrobium sp.]
MTVQPSWASLRPWTVDCQLVCPECRSGAANPLRIVLVDFRSKRIGGAGGIRTLDTAFQPYNGLANRRL